MQTPIKLSMIFFIEKNLYLYGNTKDPKIAKTILRKENRAGGLMLSDFRLYYIATVIKTVWSGH